MYTFPLCVGYFIPPCLSLISILHLSLLSSCYFLLFLFEVLARLAGKGDQGMGRVSITSFYERSDIDVFESTLLPSVICV